jgi:ribonuclease D
MMWSKKKLNAKITGLWRCTKIGSHIHSPKQSSSLEQIVPRLLGHDVPKGDHVALYGWDQAKLSDRQIEYSVNDVVYLHQLVTTMRDEMTEAQLLLWEPACRIQMDLINLEAAGFSRGWLGRTG